MPLLVVKYTWQRLVFVLAVVVAANSVVLNMRASENEPAK
jgi:hypothetical protein